MLNWLKKKRTRIELTVPGPSPWYLQAPWAQIKTPVGLWHWEFYDEPDQAGLSRLLAPTGETVLFVDFHCYVQALHDDRILIWFEVGRQEPESHESPRIAFTIIELSALLPLEEHSKIATDVRAKKERIHFLGGNPLVFEVSTTLQEGVHTMATPAEFSGLDEILVLADFGARNVASTHWDKMCRAIFTFNFKKQQVTVLPQKWFNEGDYDFGYQWITRVQRECETGQIVGEGIRLGNFRLDSSGTQIQEWLHQDVFYHPERRL